MELSFVHLVLNHSSTYLLFDKLQCLSQTLDKLDIWLFFASIKSLKIQNPNVKCTYVIIIFSPHKTADLAKGCNEFEWWFGLVLTYKSRYAAPQLGRKKFCVGLLFKFEKTRSFWMCYGNLVKTLEIHRNKNSPSELISTYCTALNAVATPTLHIVVRYLVLYTYLYLKSLIQFVSCL